VTNIHALRGIRTRDPSNQTAADLHLRTRGHGDRHEKRYYVGKIRISSLFPPDSLLDDSSGKISESFSCLYVMLQWPSSYIIWLMNNRPVEGRSSETLPHTIDMDNCSAPWIMSNEELGCNLLANTLHDALKSAFVIKKFRWGTCRLSKQRRTWPQVW
jgi:hypothetical protein